MDLPKGTELYRGVDLLCESVRPDTQTIYVTRDIAFAKKYGKCVLKYTTKRPLKLFSLWTPEGMELLTKSGLPKETIDHFTGRDRDNKAVKVTSVVGQDGRVEEKTEDDMPFVQLIHSKFPGATLSRNGKTMTWNGLVWGEGAMSRTSDEGTDSAVYGTLQTLLESKYDGIFAHKTPALRHYDFEQLPIFHEEILLFHPADDLDLVEKEQVGETRPRGPLSLSLLRNIGRGRRTRKQRRGRKRTSRKVK